MQILKMVALIVNKRFISLGEKRMIKLAKFKLSTAVVFFYNSA